MQKAISVVGLVVGVPVLIIIVPVLSLVMTSWAIITLWEWFITPAFGVIPPDYQTVMGALLILNLILYRQPQNKDDRSRDEKIYGLAFSLLMPIFAVLLGYIVRVIS